MNIAKGSEHKMSLAVFCAALANTLIWHAGLVIGLQFGMPIDDYAAAACRIAEFLTVPWLVISVVLLVVNLARKQVPITAIAAVMISLLGTVVIWLQQEYLSLIRGFATYLS